LFKEKFEFRVKRIRGQGRGEESVAVTSDGGAEGCRSCLGRDVEMMVAMTTSDQQSNTTVTIAYSIIIGTT